MRQLLVLIVLAFSSTLRAEPVFPSSNSTVNRALPEDPNLKNDTEYKKKYEEIKAQVDRLTEEAEAAKRKLQEAAQPAFSEENLPAADSMLAPESPPAEEEFEEAASEEASFLEERQPSRLSAPYIPARPDLPREGSGVLVFSVSQEAQTSDDRLTVLPVGSFVKAKVLSGVEANTVEPYPVLLQLEYAFSGPNQSRIDLSNCFMIAKARANLSTERVIMQTETISCVRENGEHFKAEAKGYTAGRDSTFGSTGTFISKQGQVLLAAVLANIAKNAGDALATAQQTTALSGDERAASATNVTGSQTAFVAGRSVVDAGAMIAQWYLDYARQLIPSIAIGSGESVHVVMLETIKVPTLWD